MRAMKSAEVELYPDGGVGLMVPHSEYEKDEFYMMSPSCVCDRSGTDYEHDLGEYWRTCVHQIELAIRLYEDVRNDRAVRVS